MNEQPRNDTPDLRRTRRLAEVLDRRMKRANLGGNELARRAGVAPQTIVNLLRGTNEHGKPTFPTTETLKQIAWGLGTNGLGERDTVAADEAYLEMATAIGYMDAPSLVYAPPLPQEVIDLLRANPDLTIDLAQTAADWDPEATKMLRQAIASYRARKVQREDLPGAWAQ
jgi:transcriptional regulator with XRE-family HTH domain